MNTNILITFRFQYHYNNYQLSIIILLLIKGNQYFNYCQVIIIITLPIIAIVILIP